LVEWAQENRVRAGNRLEVPEHKIFRNDWHRVSVSMVRTLVVVLAALAFAPAAFAGGPRMLVGAVNQAALQSGDALDLARQANLGDATRVELTWARGRRSPEQDSIQRLQSVIETAAKTGTTVYVALYPFGSSQTPLSDADQGDFTAWVTAIARAVPQARHFVIGNEPNLNRFWLPQFGPNGEDVAAAPYVSLLAKSYDALKAISPSIEVIGGTLSHAGVDRPNTGRDTHSPTAFIQDMGAAYRASGRTAPIMDAFSFHPYMLRSDEPPTLSHPNDTTITIADYGKLVALLGQAFDGTAQKGSTLPIVYDEFGVESQVPAGKESLYTGLEPTTIHPVDEPTQAAYYAQAIGLAFCQPNVKAFLVFSLIDERAHAGWQSGVYYADQTPKSSLAAVAAAADRSRRNELVCAGLQVTPRVGVRWFPDGRPPANPGTFPVSLACDVDCVYRVRIERAATHGTTLSVRGRATGRKPIRIEFPRSRLARGGYRITVWARAILNVGQPATAQSPVFVVRRRL
jgi:hypothetical protein